MTSCFKDNVPSSITKTTGTASSHHGFMSISSTLLLLIVVPVLVLALSCSSSSSSSSSLVSWISSSVLLAPGDNNSRSSTASHLLLVHAWTCTYHPRHRRLSRYSSILPGHPNMPRDSFQTQLSLLALQSPPRIRSGGGKDIRGPEDPRINGQYNGQYKIRQNRMDLHASSSSSSSSTQDPNRSPPPPPIPDTSDPYQILNISPTADKKEIKRAYKRMALRYHPDVRTNGNSTEQDRKQANDDFARINSAYAFLTGKTDEKPKSSGVSDGSGNGRRAGGYTYTPPHRRTSSYSSSSSSSSSSSYSTVDWENDYMPKYDKEEYDTGGDSFASIFSDLLSGIGSSSSSSGAGVSILNDFISFLEGNFPSVGKSQQPEEDMILNELLQNGSVEEIKDELEDAKLLVKQLEQKEFDLNSELQSVIAEKQASMMKNQGKRSQTYMEDMRLDEKRRELEVRKEVVGEYLERAKMRQFRLRRRLEELKNGQAYSSTGYGYGSGYGSGYPSGSYSSNPSQTNVGATNSGESSSYNSSGRGSSAGTNSGGTRTTTGTGGIDDQENEEPSWKREGFGGSRRKSSRRSRASSRSSTGGTTTTTTTTSGGGTYATSPPPSSSSSSGFSTTSRPNGSDYVSSTFSSGKSDAIPPHRRLTSRYEQVQQDKRRLREIKVDEEIEKMKKELGL